MQISKSIDRQMWVIGIISVLHLVGVLGVLFRVHPDFLLLTPFQLLISLGLVLSCHTRWSNRFIYFLLVSYLWGFGAELLGVNTGMLFGQYQYGSVLGWKVSGTPLMIGVNWVMLLYCSGVLVQTLFPKAQSWLLAIVGALLMVLYDILLEPDAIQYDFWNWEGGSPPLKNYTDWFWVALPMHLVFAYFIRPVSNKAAIALFCLQILFFAII